MQHHKFKIEKTAHYYTLGEPSDTVKYFWIVTHGYGQLANNILRKFEIFHNLEHFIIAPEALNRFYWDMRKGIVGASWMTKQDRLDEIEDYSNYLTYIYNTYRSQLPPNVQIIFLGFSQGTATQIRWVLRGRPECHHLVMWGGILPEDIDYLTSQNNQPSFSHYFSNKNLYFINGDEDEFVTPERITWNLEFAKKQNIAMHYLPFSGKHEILIPVLEAFFKEHVAIPV